VAGQHTVDADYFRRIDALNFSMAHDDGQLPQDLNAADIIILGILAWRPKHLRDILGTRGSATKHHHLSRSSMAERPEDDRKTTVFDTCGRTIDANSRSPLPTPSPNQGGWQLPSMRWTRSVQA